ncbi:hypothetical protein SCHPADRAFT_885784 [Schizopora paradoxa]|uniref:Uncharacterized protein n=1 Tax=Schizopora paradoxa TaxID=27342 RepID=A0A0H2S4K5_9AGAM|nr:hypothetical protein SCHPADRAFT_885784 [Schizopora paradoxa]
MEHITLYAETADGSSIARSPGSRKKEVMLIVIRRMAAMIIRSFIQLRTPHPISKVATSSHSAIEQFAMESFGEVSTATKKARVMARMGRSSRHPIIDYLQYDGLVYLVIDRYEEERKPSVRNEYVRGLRERALSGLETDVCLGRSKVFVAIRRQSGDESTTLARGNIVARWVKFHPTSGGQVDIVITKISYIVVLRKQAVMQDYGQ